jgi:FixJ family two-component response regulator
LKIPANGEPAVQQRGQILVQIVTANHDLARRLSDLLGREGYLPVGATRAGQAIVASANGRVSAVLVDMAMEGAEALLGIIGAMALGPVVLAVADQRQDVANPDVFDSPQDDARLLQTLRCGLYTRGVTGTPRQAHQSGKKTRIDFTPREREVYDMWDSRRAANTP